MKGFPTLGHGVAKHSNPNIGQMRSAVDWLDIILTAQEEKTLFAMQGYLEVALRDEQLEAVGGMIYSLESEVPGGSCGKLFGLLE